jgi:hypothetical protein
MPVCDSISKVSSVAGAEKRDLPLRPVVRSPAYAAIEVGINLGETAPNLTVLRALKRAVPTLVAAGVAAAEACALESEVAAYAVYLAVAQALSIALDGGGSSQTLDVALADSVDTVDAAGEVTAVPAEKRLSVSSVGIDFERECQSSNAMIGVSLRFLLRFAVENSIGGFRKWDKDEVSSAEVCQSHVVSRRFPFDNTHTHTNTLNIATSPDEHWCTSVPSQGVSADGNPVGACSAETQDRVPSFGVHCPRRPARPCGGTQFTNPLCVALLGMPLRIPCQRAFRAPARGRCGVGSVGRDSRPRQAANVGREGVAKHN